MSQSTVHPLDELMHYATTPDADLKTVVGGLLVCSDATTLTIVDCYRKAHYHRLILPRPRDGVPTADLRDLPTLFAGGKERARAVLADLGRAAEASKASIEADMLERWKFKWDVWVGFHAVPSMRCVGRVLLAESGREILRSLAGTCTCTSSPRTWCPTT